MNQCFIILAALFLGNLTTKILHLPIPANVVGFILLFGALCFRVIKLSHVERVSDIIINNLALFFVVPSVGIMVHFDLIKENFIEIFVPLLLSILVGMFTAAKVTEVLIHLMDKHKSNQRKGEEGECDVQ